MTVDPPCAAARAAALLQGVPDDPLEAVARLTEARSAVDSALDEQMARAALAGHSVRAVALSARLAPNSVAARLARTSGLGSYARDKRVTAAGIERARYDSELGRPAPTTPAAEPMRFRRRTSGGDR